METEITSDWIDRYTDNDLPEPEKKLLMERMHASPVLRAEVEMDARLNSFLMDDGVQDLMAKVQKVSKKNAGSVRVMKSMLIAASVLCLAMMSGIIYIVHISRATNRLAVNKPDVPKQQEEENRTATWNNQLSKRTSADGHVMSAITFINGGSILSKLEPLKEFQFLVGSVTRSSPIKLISPGVITSVQPGTSVLFSWHCIENSEQLALIIMDNHGAMVTELPVNEKDTVTFNTSGIPEGLYYWKILADDDLVFMGKLIILMNHSMTDYSKVTSDSLGRHMKRKN
jgi:hypothetical protein